MFPRRSAAALAVTVIAVEALTGLGGAAALLLWLDGPMRAASWAAAVLLALYALYGTFVSRTRTGVPCGCAGDGTPMTGWVAGRAAALALLALTGALHGLPAGSTAYEMFIAVAAGLGFAVLLWTLPAHCSRRGGRPDELPEQRAAAVVGRDPAARPGRRRSRPAGPRAGPGAPRTAGLGPAPGTPAPAFDRLGPGLLLFLDRDCGVCTDVLAAAEGPLHAIFAGPPPDGASRPGVTVLTGEQDGLFADYRVPATPFAVLVGADGRVRAAQPVGSRKPSMS